MNQRLSSWASIAEIGSSIAVVVTLIFLVVGIRENTSVTRASVYASSIDSLNEFESTILTDPELSRVYLAYLGSATASLDPADADRITLIVAILFRIYEKAYFTERYDLIGEEEWGRFERMICINYTRAETAGEAQTIRNLMTEEFMRYISACAN